MIVALTITMSVLLWVGFRLSEYYTLRSLRSYRNAERIWADLNRVAQSLLQRDITADVAFNVFALACTAGCGCYVRTLLINHYLPWASDIGKARRSRPEVDRGFHDIEQLVGEAKSEFRELMALVIAYDSFRNPLQGWLLRRMLGSHFKRPGFRESREAEIASYKVLSHEKTVIRPRSAKLLANAH
jgi:hypothetical protein